MITFLDGPAAGQILQLRRAPLLLRVVHGPKGWDGLDLLGDAPDPDEAVHVYRRVGQVVRGMIDYCGKDGRRRGEMLLCAGYQHVEPPGDEHTRNNKAWQAWCRANVGRLFPGKLPEVVEN